MPPPVKIPCPSCGMPLVSAVDPFVTSGIPLTLCLACGKNQCVLVFPADWRQGAAGAAGVAAVEGDSVCFHHQDKRAEVACEVCGRFLCELCHVDLDGRALCAACLTQMHTHSEKSKLTGNATSAHVPSRVRYDMMALGCVILAPIFTIVSFIPAGIALYWCFRHWRTPISVIPRNRWRFVVAGVGAVAILAGWVLLAVLGVVAIAEARQLDRVEADVQEVTHDDE